MQLKEAKTRICQFTIAHDLKDERVYHKECKSLAKHFDVTLVTTSKESGEMEGFNVVGLGYPAGIFKRATRIFSIIPTLLKQKCEVYHFHDPELIFTGYILKKFYKKKVVYDVHEHYTSKLRNKNLKRFSFLKKPVISVWNKMELGMASTFDLIISADSYTAAQFPAHKSIVIGNFPPLSFVKSSVPKSFTPGEEFRVVYLGTIHELRGLRKCVEAIQLVKYPNITLHIIGESRFPDLTTLFTSTPKVKYHGRIAWEKLNVELQKCHLGVGLFQPVPAFTYYPGENIVKLFEYAGLGIPYLLSDFDGLKKFVNENGGGLTVDPTDPEKIARTIESIYENRELYERLSKEGIAMVRDKFNWDNQEQKLVDAYKAILKQK